MSYQSPFVIYSMNDREQVVFGSQDSTQKVNELHFLDKDEGVVVQGKKKEALNDAQVAYQPNIETPSQAGAGMRLDNNFINMLSSRVGKKSKSGAGFRIN